MYGEIIFFCIGNSERCLYNSWSKSDRVFCARSRVLQADWLILADNENATLNISMPYYVYPCLADSPENMDDYRPCSAAVNLTSDNFMSVDKDA